MFLLLGSCFCWFLLWSLSVALDIKAVTPNDPPLCAPRLAAVSVAALSPQVQYIRCAHTRNVRRAVRDALRVRARLSATAAPEHQPLSSIGPPLIRQKRGQSRHASEVRAGHDAAVDAADARASRWWTAPARCVAALPAPARLSSALRGAARARRGRHPRRLSPASSRKNRFLGRCCWSSRLRAVEVEILHATQNVRGTKPKKLAKQK